MDIVKLYYMLYKKGEYMVKVLNCAIGSFLELLKGKRLYCFGSGRQAEKFFEKYSGLGLEGKLAGFIDNDSIKDGKKKIINKKEFLIMAYSRFAEIHENNDAVLITSVYWKEMLEQMDKDIRMDGTKCYLEILLDNTYETTQFEFDRYAPKPLIPKVIHYCWFGKNDLPAQFAEYIETWKRYCPDYEIVRWDETNYDIKKTKFVSQAYEAEKWAFVSDYARLDILEKFGGVYLDTDVELIKSLDELLYNRMFCGFEQNNYIGFGLGVGAVKGESIIGQIRELYDGMKFRVGDGKYNTVSCAIYQTQIMKSKGFVLNNKFQRRDGVTVYPSEVLAPASWNTKKVIITERTYAVHHYASTWWENIEEDQAKNCRGSLCELKKRIEQ